MSTPTFLRNGSHGFRNAPFKQPGIKEMFARFAGALAEARQI